MTHSSYLIALIQHEFSYLNIRKNKQAALEAISTAARKGAKLICLPEGFLTGYRGSDLSGAVQMACSADDQLLAGFYEIARREQIFLLLPFFEKTEEGMYNAAVLIGDQGELIGRYAKTHLIGSEKEMLKAGDDFPVWETKIGRIGCLICYDMCFPETARILTMRGAQLILVPSAWRSQLNYTSWWKLNAACRALDNVLYLAAVNQIGDARKGETFAGCSMVCGPQGDVIAAAGESEETIVYAQIDLSEIEKERGANTVLSDLRDDLYRRCEPAL